MKLTTSSILFLAPPAAAFMMPGGASMKRIQPVKAATLQETQPVITEGTSMSKRPIYDPLGLYPPSSEERRDGRIQVVMDPDIPVINEMNNERPIYDPLGLYPLSSEERRNNRIQLLESGEDLMLQKATTDPLNLYPTSVVAVNAELQEKMNQRPLHDPFVLYGPSSPERQEGRIQYAKDTEMELVQQLNSERSIFDPLTLYPDSSEERRNNRIRVLEAEDNITSFGKSVMDPLQLYPKNSAVVLSSKADMSQALPFMSRPAVLDGTLAGDAGFDPLGLAANKDRLLFMRDAELKHSRIAMLAAAGWPLSELLNKYLASMTHLKPLLGLGDRVPSVLNGGLDKVSPLFWIAVVGTASLIEIIKMVQMNDNNNADQQQQQQQQQPSVLGATRSTNVLGLDFDTLELSEIKHGRIAMLAITAFVMQEFVTKMAVVDLSPFFFHPLH